jgi:hypothetical protein
MVDSRGCDRTLLIGVDTEGVTQHLQHEYYQGWRYGFRFEAAGERRFASPSRTSVLPPPPLPSAYTPTAVPSLFTICLLHRLPHPSPMSRISFRLAPVIFAFFPSMHPKNTISPALHWPEQTC